MPIIAFNIVSYVFSKSATTEQGQEAVFEETIITEDTIIYAKWTEELYQQEKDKAEIVIVVNSDDINANKIRSFKKWN